MPHCTRSEILPTVFCALELFFSVGLTVTDLDLLYFCRGIELHFLLTDFLDHASPLNQPFHLQSAASSITSCFHSVYFPTSKVQGRGFDFLCVISWSSSDCVNCTLIPHDSSLVCSSLSEIALLPDRSSFPSVFAAHFLTQAPEDTCLSGLQSFIVCFPLSKTLPGFKEYTCMTRKTRRELKSSSPNRGTGKAFILCPCLLTFESCRTKGRCLEESRITV